MAETTTHEYDERDGEVPAGGVGGGRVRITLSGTAEVDSAHVLDALLDELREIASVHAGLTDVQVEADAAPPAAGEGRTPREDAHRSLVLALAHELRAPSTELGREARAREWIDLARALPSAPVEGRERERVDMLIANLPGEALAASARDIGRHDMRGYSAFASGRAFVDQLDAALRARDQLVTELDDAERAAEEHDMPAALGSLRMLRELVGLIPPAPVEGDGRGLRADEVRGLGDLARHIMDALDLAADDPETRHEQAAITAALTGWFDAPPVPVETGDRERETLTEQELKARAADRPGLHGGRNEDAL